MEYFIQRQKCQTHLFFKSHTNLSVRLAVHVSEKIKHGATGDVTVFAPVVPRVIVLKLWYSFLHSGGDSSGDDGLILRHLCSCPWWWRRCLVKRRRGDTSELLREATQSKASEWWKVGEGKQNYVSIKSNNITSFKKKKKQVKQNSTWGYLKWSYLSHTSPSEFHSREVLCQQWHEQLLRLL